MCSTWKIQWCACVDRSFRRLLMIKWKTFTAGHSWISLVLNSIWKWARKLGLVIGSELLSIWDLYCTCIHFSFLQLGLSHRFRNMEICWNSDNCGESVPHCSVEGPAFDWNRFFRQMATSAFASVDQLWLRVLRAWKTLQTKCWIYNKPLLIQHLMITAAGWNTTKMAPVTRFLCVTWSPTVYTGYTCGLYETSHLSLGLYVGARPESTTSPSFVE